jgi:hypothetical protein
MGLLLIGITTSSNGTYGTKLTYSNGNQSGIIDTFGNHNLEFRTNDDRAMNIAANGDISFYEDTGTTPKFVWSSSAEKLTLSGTGGLDVNTATGSVNIQAGSASADIALGVGSPSTANKVVVTAGGNVGIGTALPTNGKLVIEESGTSVGSTIRLIGTNTSGSASQVSHITSYQPAGGAAEASALDFKVRGTDPYATPSTVMTLLGGGNVGIGTTSPVAKLHLLNAGTTAISNVIANSGLLVDGGSSNAALNLITGDAGVCYVNFGDSTDSNIGRIFYQHTDNSMVFSTNVAERMRIDSSGDMIMKGGRIKVRESDDGNDAVVITRDSDEGYVNLYSEGSQTIEIRGNGNSYFNGGNVLVGTTSTSASVAGGRIFSTGRLVTSVNNEGHYFRRNSSDGTIVEFAKDGTTVGCIGTDSGDLTIYSTVAGHTGFRFGNSEVYPTNNGGSLSDNTMSLGSNSIRFKDLYLSGGVVFGTTGGSVTSKTLDDYEEGTWTPVVSGSTTAGSATYTIQQGVYTKIGNVVRWNARVGYTGHTGTGNMLIWGLPFTNANKYAAGSYSFRDGLTLTAGDQLIVSIPPNNTYIGLYGVASGTDTTAALALDTAVSDISINGVYTV